MERCERSYTPGVVAEGVLHADRCDGECVGVGKAPHFFLPVMDVDALQQRLHALLTQQSQIVLAYLFGSQISGHVGPQSDIDIGVLVDWTRDVDPTELCARLTHEIVGILDTGPVDVILLNRAPIELAYSVIAQGCCLYSSHRIARIDYEAYVLGRYGDYLPVLRAQRQQIIDGTSHETRVQRYRAALGRTERTLGALETTS